MKLIDLIEKYQYIEGLKLYVFNEYPGCNLNFDKEEILADNILTVVEVDYYELFENNLWVKLTH